MYVCTHLCMMYVCTHPRTSLSTFLNTNFHTYVRINDQSSRNFLTPVCSKSWSFTINLKQNASVYSITKQCYSLMLLLHKNWNRNCHVSSLTFSVALSSSCIMPLAHYIFVFFEDECCWYILMWQVYPKHSSALRIISWIFKRREILWCSL